MALLCLLECHILQISYNKNEQGLEIEVLPEKKQCY